MQQSTVQQPKYEIWKYKVQLRR